MLMELTDTEKKKEYLNGYKNATEEINKMKERYSELKMSKIYPPVISDGMPHASNKTDLSGYASKVDEMERKIVKARYNRIKKKQEIEKAIKTVEKEDERNILFLRYIRLLSWNQIMDVTGIRPLYKIFRVHGRALNHVIIDWFAI